MADMVTGLCTAPLLDFADLADQEFCGRDAVATVVVGGVVFALCAEHATEMMAEMAEEKDEAL